MVGGGWSMAGGRDDRRDEKWGLRRGLRRTAGRLLRGRRTAAASSPPVWLTVEGYERIAVPVGQTLLQAVVEAQLELSHYCGGMASCGTCRVEVLAGAENLSAMQGREEMVLGSRNVSSGARLGCQARMQGPVTVRIPRWF